jgi:hypothetical protein
VKGYYFDKLDRTRSSPESERSGNVGP